MNGSFACFRLHNSTHEDIVHPLQAIGEFMPGRVFRAGVGADDRAQKAVVAPLPVMCSICRVK